MTTYNTSRVEHPHPVENTEVYVLDGITYLPHYRAPGLFVSPGYGNPPHGHQNTLTGPQLICAGANKIMRSLWVR